MSSEHVECRTLTVDESRLFFTPGVFGAKPAGWKTQQPDEHLLLFKDDKAVCHVGICVRECMVDGSKTLVGGIGGVITAQDDRRLGYAKKAISHAVARLQDEHRVELCVLFCLPHLRVYYELLGWHEMVEPFLLDGQAATPRISAFSWPHAITSLDLQGVAW